MAHECHSVDARRRAAVALDCLMAYESFERDWHLEKLNQPVIDRVKLAVTNENEKLIQKMIGECDAADRRRYEEDLRLDRSRAAIRCRATSRRRRRCRSRPRRRRRRRRPTPSGTPSTWRSGPTSPTPRT